MTYEEPNTIPTEDDMNAMYEAYEKRIFNVECVHCLVKSIGSSHLDD